MTWLSNWDYRKSITISNSGSTLTNYQILITVDTATLISSSKMRSDCGDIRFASSDGSTLIDYWIESGINSSSTIIWVEIPSISSGNNTIYMYYGNSSATSLSDGTNTFEFFEDFTNLSKWTAAGSTGYLSIADGTAAFRIYRHGDYRITSPFSMPVGTNYAIEFRYKQYDPCNGGSPCYGGYFLAGLSSSTNNPTVSANTVNYQGIQGFASKFNSYQLVYNKTQSGTTGIYGTNFDPYPDNTWTNYRIIRNSTTVYYYAYADGTWTSPLFSTSLTDTTGNSYSYVYLGTIYEDTYVKYSDYWVDNFRIRKYSSPEPTFSLGTEELPVNITATSMTITPSETPCRHNICSVTVDVTWTNTGVISGSFLPNITIDTIPISPDPYPSEELAPDANVTKSFVVSNLAVGTRNICPYPN